MPSRDSEALILTRLDERVPRLEAIRGALQGMPAWLVGGTVRDLLLGRECADVDVVVDGDPAAVAARLGGETRAHQRFGTVAVKTAEFEVDLARARAETYPAPGALPQVRPGTLEEDLARRDFTINAMAIALTDSPELLDPHGGEGDARAGALRVLHDRSLVDDPTRAIRAARYAARLGFALESSTADVVRAADLRTVSRERVEAELRKLAGEPDPATALGLLVDWGLASADVELGAASMAIARTPRFAGVDAPAAFLAGGAVVAGGYAAPVPVRAVELAKRTAGSPSELTAAARGASGVELVVACALGADWIDEYVDGWRGVRLEISGADLLAAGVPEGPMVGTGLTVALRRKLDGEVSGREAELRAALEAARG